MEKICCEPFYFRRLKWSNVLASFTAMLEMQVAPEV